MIKLNSFINMFHQLWKAGDTAHLNLNTHAGQAWVGIRTPLGHPGQPQQYPHQTPNYHQYSHPSPTIEAHPTSAENNAGKQPKLLKKQQPTKRKQQMKKLTMLKSISIT